MKEQMVQCSLVGKKLDFISFPKKILIKPPLDLNPASSNVYVITILPSKRTFRGEKKSKIARAHAQRGQNLTGLDGDMIPPPPTHTQKQTFFYIIRIVT